MLYPAFPKVGSGDCIGVFAPSAGVGHKLESFDTSLRTISECGYSIKEQGNLRADALRPDTGMNRARDFASLVADPSVKTIISAAGGEFCLETLPYIDAELFAENPKWFCGASDPTSILYYLTTKLDIATIYGFNAGTFDWNPLHKFQENALSIIQGDIVKQGSFDKYDNNRDFSKSGVSLEGDVYWNLYNADDNGIDISGRLIGGCSDVLSSVIGTPYDHTEAFLERYKDEGIIWYFDPFEANPISLHLTMLQFKYAGWFDNAKAVIIGRIMFDGGYSTEDFAELLKDDFDCPFVLNADIGHVKPCMTLVNGSYANIKCRDGKTELTMELR